MSYFLTGLIGGFVIAAPVGPIGMLCIRRSIAEGRMVGFASGLGAATADAVYGAVAGFGLTTISNFLRHDRTWVQLVGGLILIWIGIAEFRAQPVALVERQNGPRNLWGSYSSTLLLTLMNPMTVISFIAVFAGVGLGGAPSEGIHAVMLVVGVFLGSVAWWFAVSLAGGWLGNRLEHGGLRIVNIIAGTFICAIGAWQLFSAGRSIL